jgi:hypothetical protein
LAAEGADLLAPSALISRQGMFERWLKKLVSCLTLATLGGATECKPVIIEEGSSAQECGSNSDCDSATVCAFRRCHDACSSSADCARGRCVIAEPGGVCQLDQESSCARNSDCPPALLCGADGQCRNACRTNQDCLGGQLCSLTGECADISEVDPNGSLKGTQVHGDPGASSTAGSWSNASASTGGKGGMSAGGAANGATGGYATAATSGYATAATSGYASAGAGGKANLGTAGMASAGKAGVNTGGSGGVGGTPPWGVAGSGGQGGTGATEGAGGAAEPEGVPLVPNNGWLAGDSNALMIQGAIFPYADPVATLSLSQDFTGANACIKGTAPKVDLSCIPDPGSTCYGKYFGSGIGLYLDQPLDLSTDPATVLSPLPFDASSLKGFSFELTGNAVPQHGALRFGVFTADAEFCRVNYDFKIGRNTVLFDALVANCYSPPDAGPMPESARSALIRVGWHVMTNPATAFDYDFCVSDIRALLK